MIDTVAALRAIYGEPMPLAVKKQHDRLDKHCLRFLELSPMVMIATCDGTRVDVSPKGDGPGFVQTDGDTAVLIPDWPGNNRLDGYENILRNGQAGLLFLIPGLRETLRINGRASIHADEALRARFETRGKLPITVLRVETDEVYLHCAKAFLRSKLWDPSTWTEKAELPKPGEMFKDQIGLEGPAEEAESMHARYAKNLY
ncbi:MAG: pyridoxamine 5'-phosphate oxidase family protein [Pseudomonadota bacterium]|nr:pyridoxamine 5'-phosphate oxidase family protein [Pseudomonadota bacterium]MEE3100397.1 pyridoxamine 5'-phosphate oxidase family protein [Pseudomonadota bacterium]